MDKLNEFAKVYFGRIVGTTITSFVVRIVIALLALYTGSATDVGDAIGLALDKQRSIATAAQLINETPEAEIVKAIEAAP
jgi:hypothetical protein